MTAHDWNSRHPIGTVVVLREGVVVVGAPHVAAGYMTHTVSRAADDQRGEASVILFGIGGRIPVRLLDVPPNPPDIEAIRGAATRAERMAREAIRTFESAVAAAMVAREKTMADLRHTVALVAGRMLAEGPTGERGEQRREWITMICEGVNVTPIPWRQPMGATLSDVAADLEGGETDEPEASQ